MGFPRKWKHLIETSLEDLETPDRLFVVYGVCVAEKDSCGWKGWILESVYKKSNSKHSITDYDLLLESDSEYKCPNCGRDLFRTDTRMIFEKSTDQGPAAMPVEFECLPIEWDD